MVRVAVGKGWDRWWMRAERGEGGGGGVDVDGGVGMVGVVKLG